jgi:hypothetical protein
MWKYTNVVRELLTGFARTVRLRVVDEVLGWAKSRFEIAVTSAADFPKRAILR